MKTLHGKKQESIDRSLEFSKLGKAFYVPNVLMALINRPIIKVDFFSGFKPAVSQPWDVFAACRNFLSSCKNF